MGGSLRMDKYKQPDGTYTYDKTDLRFGYHITLPKGAKLISWGWDYGKSADRLDYHRNGTNYIVLDNDGSGQILESNLLFERVPLSGYKDVRYVRMTVTYELNGERHTYVGETVKRSVAEVASAVAHSSSETQEAREYAQKILNALEKE